MQRPFSKSSPSPAAPLDGSGDPVSGYVTRGGRMWTEEAYVCLWNVLESIPTLDDPARSVKDDVWAFNDVWHSNSHARLIGTGPTTLDATDLGLSLHDYLEPARLLGMPERVLGSRRMEDCFSPHFFPTNFWAMWRTRGPSGRTWRARRRVSAAQTPSTEISTRANGSRSPSPCARPRSSAGSRHLPGTPQVPAA